MSGFSGYNPEIEDRAFLSSLPSGNPLLAMAGTYEEIKLDPRELIKVENQKSQGACLGHSLSSILEWCGTIATGGKFTELSRAMAYYETQRIDGINGDRGATVSGGVKLALLTGLCEESIWQYPSVYNPARPANYVGVLANAAKHKAGRAIKIRTYDEYRIFVGSGQGGVSNGIAWDGSMSKAVIESFQVGSRSGGHAIAGLCLSERVDSQARPYVWILNSWSESFGSQVHPGWMEWSPAAISQMLSHQWTEMVGISDMPSQKPRKFSLDDWKQGLRT